MNYSKITSVKKDIFFKFFNVCFLFQLHQYNTKYLIDISTFQRHYSMGKHCVKMTSYERKVVEDDVYVPGCPGRVSVMCCVAWPGQGSPLCHSCWLSL